MLKQIKRIKMSKENDEMRERSGKVDSNDPIVSFLYELMRDYLPVGDVEKIVRDCYDKETNEIRMTTSYTNGWLAKMAMDMAGRLK
jgi:hypothetical protein